MVKEGDDLPSRSRIVRYAGYNKMAKDIDVVIGPSPTAFYGAASEDYLSVTWCEYFLGTADEQLRCAIEAIRSSELKPGRLGCFCIADADEVIAASKAFGRTSKVVYHPFPDNLAHAGVYDIAPADIDHLTEHEALLLALLAETAWSRFLTKDGADKLPFGSCIKSHEVE